MLQEDSSGNSLTILGVMHDDGLDGDAVAGDGVYTLVVPFSPASQTTAIYVQASVAFQGALQRVKSPVLAIPVFTPVTTLILNPASLVFPAQNVGSTSSAQQFAITNSGNQPVTINSITSTGDFAIGANTCPGILPVSATCNVGVTFTPIVAGTRTSSVVITDSATGSPQSVSLSGTGQQPAGTPTITINPTSLTFPAQNLKTTSAAESITITNSGSQPVTISSVTTSGDFAITANTCPASLTVNGNCSVSVAFTPTVTGNRTSSVVITDNAIASPQSVGLAGIGQQPTGTPTITINPTSLTFLAQNLQTTSPAQSFKITNSGPQPVTISSITLSGDFAISANSCGASLAVSTSCTVSVTFTPTATGNRASNVIITDNVSGSPQSVALSGTGQPAGPPTITINPTSLTFPTQSLKSTSAAESFTIKNSGSQSVMISAITTSGDFAIGNNTCPSSLAVSTNCTVGVTFTPTATGTRTSNVVITDNASGSPQSLGLSGTGQQPTGPFEITSFNPSTGSIGTLVKVVLSNFTPGSGMAPTVTMAGLNSAGIVAPLSAFSTNALSFVVPPGARSGDFTIGLSPQSATSPSAFTVTPSSNITLTVGPTTADLIQGQSVTYAVTVNSPNGFDGLATLAVTGVPSGVQSSFKPPAITAGQTATFTLSAPASQKKGSASLSFSASAMIDGQSVSQSATANLNITEVTTSFLGRTVVDDAQETPIGGVSVKFLGKDAQGNVTGCSGQTASDVSGNFLLANLPQACTGPQLVEYDGTTATSPAGKYAGVNLSYTLVSAQVTVSPVLVHLPRIDNAETVQIKQNSSMDQVFTFSSMPGLQVTVYAGTKFTLDDGSQPSPFPLTAVQIPLDRLPEQVPTNGMLMNFVVAFQPANATASQPVAVVFPNPLNLAPLSTAMLTTLDPTRGFMVPYGTTTVASDGRTFVPDLDPAHPGHRYGLVHFDWHTPLASLLALIGLSPDTCPCITTHPIDLSAGIETYTTTDLQIRGGRGSIAIQRTYRTLDKNPGPFGIGTGFNYSYVLNVLAYTKGQPLIDLIMPNGNQYPLASTPDGTLSNSTIPALRGVVLTPNQSSGTYTLRQLDGTAYTFTVFPSQGIGGAYLTSIKDLNGNLTTITLDPNQPIRVIKVTDPVGRSLNLTYDNTNRITRVTDPIGRTVNYTYNGQGALETFTDANGGVTSYTYDSGINVTTITDPRGIVIETNTYNEAGDGRVTQQVDANGGITKFSYTLLNQAVADVQITSGFSPVLQTVVTDPRGNVTIYRFNPAGFLLSATDPSGQTTTLTHDAGHNNLITAYQGAGVCVSCGSRANGDTSYTYDHLGNQLTQTDALGHTTTYTYDPRFNKVNSISDPLGNVTKLSYDNIGNLLNITDANHGQTQLTYDSFGETTQITDPLGTRTRISYDSLGNITSVTDALGHPTTLSYDAVSRLTQVQDALGRVSRAKYDNLDRITSQTDPRGSTINLAYDSIGNLLSFTDARMKAVTFTYDSIGRLKSRTSQLNKVESYRYDANSNPVQFTDRRGQESNFQYDLNNRLVKETYSDATVTRSYDANGRLLAVNDSQGGTFEFTYDAAGHLLVQAEPTGAVQYGRDALGRVITQGVAGQSAADYTYDSVGNMLSAAFPTAGVTYRYDARNFPQSLSRTNGLVTNYSYDQLGRVLSIVHMKAGVPLNTQTYTYDSIGNKISGNSNISQPLTTPSANSTVDAANELISKGTTTYTSDGNGNRLTEASSAGTVNYFWDGRNRLSMIMDSAGNKTALHYDFARNLVGLVRETAAGTTQQSFLIDSLNNVVSFTDPFGKPTSILTGRQIDSYYASNDAGTTLFGLTDSLGSEIGFVDSAGSLTSKLGYEPYGQLTSGVPTSLPLAFTRTLPITSDISYFRNRFYDGSAGKFISEDPLDVNASEGNLYRYAFNNPTNYIDPTGLLAFGETAGGSLEIGIGPQYGGVAIQGGGGYGLFYDQDNGGMSVGAYGAGAFVDVDPSLGAYGYPSQPRAGYDFILGASAGKGLGYFLSNARTAGDLHGPFCAVNVTLGGVSVSLQVGQANDGKIIYIGTIGTGAGISVSRYITNTPVTLTLSQ